MAGHNSGMPICVNAMPFATRTAGKRRAAENLLRDTLDLKWPVLICRASGDELFKASLGLRGIHSRWRCSRVASHSDFTFIPHSRTK